MIILIPRKSEEESEKENKKDSISDMELTAAKKREEEPLEERVAQFKSLLAEKDVSAFSTWEKELHKIVFDPRYLLLTSKERKVVFDEYVKDRAEEERQEKRLRYKKTRDDFRKLLEEAKLSTRTTFSDFCQKYSKDERFKNIEKMREKEGFFNDFMAEIRRKDRENKSQQRERYKKEFLELLKERHEKKPFERNIRWSEVKECIRDDSRYKNLESSSEKEEIFKGFLSQVITSSSKSENSSSDTKQENHPPEDSKDREKRERAMASLKEREDEVRKLKSTQEEEREKERDKHKHKEAVETFTALLMDLIRSPDVSWRDAKKTLKKDKRMSLVENSLDRDVREKLFGEHIDRLNQKKKEKFREMLSEVKDLSLTTGWRDVRRQVKDDPRYLKFSSSDRRCEREFNDYMEYKLNLAKEEFKEFLRETKILTYKSKKLIDESDQHLQDIIAVLQNDKRYLVLDCIEDERREILMRFVDELEKNGPPPPPTATGTTKTRHQN